MMEKNNNSLWHIHNLLIMLLCLGLSTSGYSAEATTTSHDTQYWRPIIKELEGFYAAYPNDPKIQSKLSTAYNNYGLLLSKQGDMQGAVAAVQRGLQINPGDIRIKANLSNLYLQQAYDAYESRPGSVYDPFMYTQAKQLVLQALQINASNINAYILLGDIEYMNQEMTEAQRAWQKAASLAPEHAEIQARLAQITRETDAESNMQNRYNAYFIIKIDPSVNNLAGFDINQSLNAARIAVSRDFNYTPTKKIPVIVYNAEQYYDTIIQAPQWSEAAYDGKLRIMVHENSQNFKQLNSNIVHEYTHAVLEDITGNHMPRWLNEGIAKYEEYRHGVPPLINILALGVNTNTILPWDKIDDAFLSHEKSTVLLAYQQSFSFIYYLVAQYGFSKLNQLLIALKTQPDLAVAFKQTYFIELSAVQQMWRQWLPRYIQQWAEAG